MTTRPKARRFRLKLGEESGDSLRTSVSPQRDGGDAGSASAAAETPRPETPSRATPRSDTPAAAHSERPQRSATPPSDGLFDEESGATPPQTRSMPSAPANEAPATPPRAARRRRVAASPDSDPGVAAQPALPTGGAAATGDRPAQQVPQTSQPTSPQSAATPNAAPNTASGASATVRGSDPVPQANPEADIDAIRDEGLSGRQLRMAMRVAQRNGIKASSGLEAVRLLRKAGIDPFERSTLLDIVKQEGTKGREIVPSPSEDEAPKLPKAYRQPPPPAEAPPAEPAEQRRLEVSKIQKEISRRRRRRMTLLLARLLVFVGLPTLITGWYFFNVATPLYATNSEFIIQQADAPAAGAGGLGGMLGASHLGSVQDSVTVQSYLQSRDAMRRLNEEHGFKSYFQQDFLDPLRRLAPDATDEAAYRLYEDVIQVSFDPTEGIIRMEVVAADPETSERFAHALVQYAEEQVDQLTQRLRENQMNDAQQSVSRAEERMVAAQQRVLDLQESYQVLSSEVEVTLLTQQITNLETQLNQERLSLSDLEANARPNPARLEQARRRIVALETQITQLRASLTQGANGGTSLARVQRELVMAESDVQTRQMLLAQAMQQMEAARLEANRQVRYLSLGVSPVAPDEPTYPRAFENTALAFLIFAGLYLMISMTAAILREQVTG